MLLRLLCVLILLAVAMPVRAAEEGVPTFVEMLADCRASADAACAGQQEALAPQWPKALKGDELALRNFAFCLGNGCYGALKVDPVMACALRIVVAARAGVGLTADDRAGFERDCGALDEDGQSNAKLRARSLYRAIAAANR